MGSADEPQVLVVDDDAGMRETLVDLLATRGLHALAAPDGGAAEQLAARHPFAVAVVDYRLPDTEGVQLAGRLKERDADIAVLLLTGYATVESAVAAVGLVDGYLVKPVAPEALLQAVLGAAERSRLRRENRELVRQLRLSNESLHRGMTERQAELSGLIAMSEAVGRSARLDQVLDAAVEAAQRATGATSTALYLSDSATPSQYVLQGVRVEGWTPPMRIPADIVPMSEIELAGRRCVVTLLVSNGAVKGALLLERPAYRNAAYLSALTTLIAVGIDNAHRFELEQATYQRLVDLNRLRSHFLASLSHELRTPLTAVIGFTHTLRGRGRVLPAEEQQVLLERIERQAQHLQRLVDDLLDATQIESGTMRVRNAPVDVATAIREAVDSLPDPVHRIEQDIAEVLPLVLADGDRLRQVLVNLLDNAAKYSPVGSRITVSGRADPTGVEIAVADEGIGVSPAFLPHLFDPFTQEDTGDTRRNRGVGLGLSISRGLVEAMGGTISVDSVPDRGSVFRVLLPRVLPRQVDTPEPASTAGRGAD